ncbi:DUF6470 family protein [Metabacillus bambusae]|uniref:YviE n=1 Tax=Metabacillus bambusae TaxID=2795218 RepID=A0ABS3N0R5_9BACI|nr:DUF6470 family protein [Metabacillus bambusae]MBO1511745.1 hypothetical protein [Metabacillus bambusae]
MKIPQIRLDSTMAQIGIQTNNAVNNIQQPMANLSIEQPKASIQMKTTPSKLTIDQSEARADMDLKSIARRTEEFAQNGKKVWLEGLARRAQQGEALMKIENPGNPIASQAKLNSEKPMKEFGLAFIPSPGSVKINYKPSKLEIDIKQNKPTIDVGVNKPIFDYKKGNVDIYLQRRNELNIDVEMINIKA